MQLRHAALRYVYARSDVSLTRPVAVNISAQIDEVIYFL